MEELFVKNLDELTNSIVEFNKAAPELMRKSLGGRPECFVHVKTDGKDYFGLAKFCAFRNTSVKEYLIGDGRRSLGKRARRHIERITEIRWVKKTEANEELRKAFDTWIVTFHTRDKWENVSFISIESPTIPVKIPKPLFKHKNISPKKLLQKFALQEKIGKVGEKIALEFEMDELKKMGILAPEKYIRHESQSNAAAGYDICNSYPKRERYIEVKASMSKSGDFFITENEIKTLEYFGESAFLYLVHVTDFKQKKGKVDKIIPNPIKRLETKSMKPVAYRVSGKNL